MQTLDDKRTEFGIAIISARSTMLKRAKRDVGVQDAEDVVQSALCTALGHARWEEIERPAAWVMGVLDNEIRTYSKKKIQMESRERPVEAWERAYEDVAAYEDDIVDKMLEEEDLADRIAIVMRAIEKGNLTVKEDYVILARLRGRSDVKIAEQLGIETNAVRAYHSMAVAKIRAAIAPKGGGQ